MGLFLHELFETLDFPQAVDETLKTAVTTLSERYGPMAMEEYAPVIQKLVTNVLETPLAASDNLRLRDVSLNDRLVEMAFCFPVVTLDPDSLREILASFPEYVATGEGLTFEPVRGLMRGFIDLLFRHDGRFYIVDYKSNLLGHRLSDYGREGLCHSVRKHRYDLQYLIYTVAVHRYLRRRLPQYHYTTHFGGVYNLFLRGMRPAHGSRYGVWQDRPPYRLVDRLDRLFDRKI